MFSFCAAEDSLRLIVPVLMMFGVLEVPLIVLQTKIVLMMGGVLHQIHRLSKSNLNRLERTMEIGVQEMTKVMKAHGLLPLMRQDHQLIHWHRR